MANTGAIRAGRAYVEIFTDNNPLSQGLRAAEGQILAFGRDIRRIGIDMAAMGAAIAGPLLKAATMTGNLGMELWTMSKRTGLTIEKLTALNYAVRQCGVSSDILDKGIRYMNKNLFGAAQGSKDLQKAFNLLGISVADFQNMTVDERLLKMADAISQVKDPTEKAALAMKIFGRNGTAMLPFLEAGSAKIRQFMEEAARLGVVLSTGDVIAAVKFQQTLNDLWGVIKIGIFRVGSALIPVLTDWAQRMMRATALIAEFIRQHQGIVVAALYAGTALVAAGAAFITFGQGMIAISKTLSIVRVALNAFAGAVGLIFSPWGKVIAVLGVAAGVLLYFGGVTGWLGEKFGSLKTDAVKAFEGISAALAGGDIGLAAEILWLTLKMEWQKGTLALLKIWIEFKKDFLTYWDGLGYAMVLSWDTAVYLIKTAWAETMAFVEKLMLNHKATFADIFDWIAAQFIKIFHPEIPAEKINALLEKRKVERWTAAGKEKELTTVEAEKKSAEDKAAKNYEEQKTAIGESYAKDLEKIGKGAAGEDEIRKRQEKLDRLNDNLEDEMVRTKMNVAAGITPTMPAGNAPAYNFDTVSRQMANVVFGTFEKSALGLVGVMGAANTLDKIAENTGKTVDILEDMNSNDSGLEYSE